MNSCFGTLNFAFKQDCSCCGAHASTVLPNFRHCISSREPHCPISSLVLPPVSSIVSSLALDAATSFSSSAGTLRLPPFCVYLHRHFYNPQLLLGPPGSVNRGSNYGITCFPVFLHTVNVWPHQATRRFVVCPGHVPSSILVGIC